jgi:putative membrane fusion protein
MKNKRKNSEYSKSNRTTKQTRQTNRNKLDYRANNRTYSSTNNRTYNSNSNSNSNRTSNKTANMDNNKTENKSGKRRFKTGRLLLIIFVLVYIPSLIYWFYGNTVATDIVHTGVIEDSMNINALLVRDETVLKAPFSGEYIPQVDEGDKVAAYSTVATVLDSSSSRLLDEINEINKKILSTQKEKSKSKEIFNQDITKIENEIGLKVAMIADEVNNNRFNRIKQIRYEIDGLIEKKAEIIGNDGTDDVYIKSLKEQKNKLMNDINTSMLEKKSDSSGMVSYIIDGYESILNPQAVDKLTPEIFENILSEEVIERDLSNRKVEADKPYAKIINDFQYQIIVCLKSDSNDFFEIGKRVSIRINDINKQIRCTVAFVSEEYEGKQIIAISADKYIGELSGVRKINIDLIKSSYDGLMVPLRCLRNISTNNMTAELVLLKGDIASVREAKIIGKNNEYAIVEAIDKSNKGIYLYDTYITNPQNIQDGQVIN